MQALAVLVALCAATANAYAPALRATKPRQFALRAAEKSFVENAQTSISIFQKSTSDGADFKQAVADALAGDYDKDAIQTKLRELSASAPCVVFTWDASPFSKKALKYLDVAGAKYKNVRLDDPWSEGNPLRAELGKLAGRTSVPSVFIGGEYVGGFDGGVSDEKPGILDLAFQGKLRPKLEDAGAL